MSIKNFLYPLTTARRVSGAWDRALGPHGRWHLLEALLHDAPNEAPSPVGEPHIGEGRNKFEENIKDVFAAARRSAKKKGKRKKVTIRLPRIVRLR